MCVSLLGGSNAKLLRWSNKSMDTDRVGENSIRYDICVITRGNAK